VNVEKGVILAIFSELFGDITLERDNRTARERFYEHQVYRIPNGRLRIDDKGTTHHPTMALIDVSGRFTVMVGSGYDPKNLNALKRHDILPPVHLRLHVKRSELNKDSKLYKDTFFFQKNVPLLKEEFIREAYLDDFAQYPALLPRIRTLKEKYRNG
jgi:hypothetical protein